MKALEKNTSLKGLNLSRKKLNELDGIEISKAVKNNIVLERLVLEGNEFGPKTAYALGDLFRHNSILKVIDLENNNLT